MWANPRKTDNLKRTVAYFSNISFQFYMIWMKEMFEVKVNLHVRANHVHISYAKDL